MFAAGRRIDLGTLDNFAHGETSFRQTVVNSVVKYVGKRGEF
jgi:hypothetical protein